MTAVLWSLFDLKDTASRKRGWLVFGLLLGLALLARPIITLQPEQEGPVILLFGAVLVVWVVTKVQRLHDAGYSGYWVLTTIIPFLPAIVILCLPPRATRAAPHPMARRLGYLGLGLLAALILSRAVLWHPYMIPSESNKPTLMIGDYVIATRTTPAAVQRGDMVVFRHPVNGEVYIKRLIGLPGDTVQMQGGVLLLNGVTVPKVAAGTLTEPYDPASRQHCANAPQPGEACQTPRFTETLPGGPRYSVLDIETSPQDDTALFTVPEGAFFALGDNRDNSLDSRFAADVGGPGFVPLANLLGRARWVAFSTTGGLMAGRNGLALE